MYDLETPALLLHRDVVLRNVTRMAERGRQLGVRLRPHAKTHKCVELGRLQLEHGAQGLTVATLVEARELAHAGLTDLTWAFPLDPTHLGAHAASGGRRRTGRDCCRDEQQRDEREHELPHRVPPSRFAHLARDLSGPAR